jgi:hypothetical protein
MATKTHLVIDQGATFNANVVARVNATTANTLDLTGFPVGYGQIRPSYQSTSVAGTFDVDTHVSNTGGVVGISLSDSATSDIPAGNYVYDIKVAGFFPGGLGSYGVGNTLGTNSVASNTVIINKVPAAISVFNSPNNSYAITNGVYANSAYSDARDNYIGTSNDVTLSIVTHIGVEGVGDTSLLVQGWNTNSGGQTTNAIGFREVIFANVEVYGANSAYVGNSFLQVSGSQHPNAFFNNAYVETHTSNSHPLHDVHFKTHGISINTNARWIYSFYMLPSHGGDGEGFPIRMQAYTANATHDPNTTSFFTHVGSNDAPFDTGATGPHGAAAFVNVYPTAPAGSGEWSRVSTVIDLRTQVTSNTHLDWHKDTLIGNNHVENAINVFLTGRLHFRDQVDQLSYGSSTYPDYSILHDGSSVYNEIQYWRVGDLISTDIAGGFHANAHGGRTYTDFWGTVIPWTRQYRIISDINEAAPWVDTFAMPYGGTWTLPRSLAANSTYAKEYFAQTINHTLRSRNNARFQGANTHNKMILSFSPYFTKDGDYVYIDGIQLEEQSNAQISTPSDLDSVSLSSATSATVQFVGTPAVIRISEGTIEVTPGVTR